MTGVPAAVVTEVTWPLLWLPLATLVDVYLLLLDDFHVDTAIVICVSWPEMRLTLQMVNILLEDKHIHENRETKWLNWVGYSNYPSKHDQNGPFMDHSSFFI